MISIVVGSYILIPTSCDSSVTKILKPLVTIADLKAKQSVFADSLVTLHDVKIKSCESVLNYSKAVITDESGETILLLSDKPFKSGETIHITGRMLVVYQNEDENFLVFVDAHLKPMNDLLRLVKRSAGL